MRLYAAAIIVLLLSVALLWLSMEFRHYPESSYLMGFGGVLLIYGMAILTQSLAHQRKCERHDRKLKGVS